MIKLGQLLTRVAATFKPAGICQRWGCGLMVGKRSAFGPGPICLVCEHNLRAFGTSNENTTEIQVTPARPHQYCSRQDAVLREEVLPPKRGGPEVAI